MHLLAHRTDGERVQIATAANEGASAQPPQTDQSTSHLLGNATFDQLEPSRISIMICLPESRIDELTAPFYASCQASAPREAQYTSPNCLIETIDDDFGDLSGGETDSATHISAIAPRPIVLPPIFADKYDVDQRQFCVIDAFPSSIIYKNQSNTEFNSPNSTCNGTPCDDASSLDFSVVAPNDALVVAAISPMRDARIALLLWFLFATALYATIAAAMRLQMATRNTPSAKRPIYGRFDGILAFILAMLASYAIANAAYKFFHQESALFPGFYATATLMLSNFVAFLSAFAVIRLFRVFVPISGHSHDSIAPASPTPDAVNTAQKLINSDQTQNLQSSNEILHTDNSNEEQSAKTKKTDLKTKLIQLYERLCNGVQRHPLKFALYTGVLLAVLAAVVSAFCPIPGLTVIELSSRLTSSSILIGFSVLLAAIAEETIFRGVIQGSLSARSDSKHPRIQNAVAILVATFVFVFVHVPQSVEHLWALIPIGLFSLAAGWIRLQTGSVLPAIATHMTYNGILVLPTLAAIF